MDITDLVDLLRQDLIRAADLGDEATRAAAERLLLALDPALRLTLMDALSQAAAEIGAAAPGLTVGVRLQGREPVFVVEGAAPGEAAESAQPDDANDEQVTRITLRLPETLKSRTEALAAQRGQSLTTWLVAAARATADRVDAGRGQERRHGQRVTGWAR
ncbi:MAG TPA: hypothetical protein VGL58_05525 [Caulobacteraceae bacterium]